MKKLFLWGMVIVLSFCLVSQACCVSLEKNMLNKIALGKDVSFNAEKLSKVMDVISNLTNTKIVVLQEVSNIQITASFKQNTSLKEIMDLLKQKYGIEYTVTPKGILISYYRTSADLLRKCNRVTDQCILYCEAESSIVETKQCMPYAIEPFNTEEYSRIYSNIFHKALSDPLSTFSIDVDTASYSNVRRFIDQGQLPQKDAVRIEELINYFSYNYPEPTDEHPISITTDFSDCLWNKDHKLVKIGIQGKTIDLTTAPPSNLVFLIDVSGSMSSLNKLPLLKKAFKLLVNNLRSNDIVSIVLYAGAAGVVLDSVKGDRKETIINALENLSAGGSTAGGQGIMLAYDIAKKNYIKEGNNRVILATDGDFNVGVSSTGDLTRLIESKRNEGIYLTVLGFGMGNYKDNRLENLADKGNGNYGYIDNILEAKKLFVNQLGGTLFTIARDVKIQVEFNPAKVKEYRLIGYENRLLNKEDFTNDKKDAGEIGAGHTVTVLYELVMAEKSGDNKVIEDTLKYQNTTVNEKAYHTSEIMTVKVRYKEPNEDTSKLITKTVSNDNYICFEEAPNDFKFASAVVELGLLLRNSDYKSNASYEHVIKTAKESKGDDSEGYRADFIRLAEICELLNESQRTGIIINNPETM